MTASLMLATRPDQRGRESMQVGLVAGRNLQGRGLDFDKTAAGEPGAQAGRNSPARQQIRPAGGVRSG